MSFSHDPSLRLYLPTHFYLTWEAKEKAFLGAEMHSAGVYQGEPRIFLLDLHPNVARTSALELTECQDPLHQNKLTSKYFGFPSSESCFITLGSQRNKRTLLSSELFLHVSGYAVELGN